MAVSVPNTKAMARNDKEILRPRITTDNHKTEQIKHLNNLDTQFLSAENLI
jgi:hypothetical protein